MRLHGSARGLGRTVTPLEIMHGGVVNGQQLDPVSYIIHGFHTRFALLDEEAILSAMTEMMAFARRPNESINALLSRHEVVRQRAAAEGQFVMSIEGLSLQILRTRSVNSQQLFQCLQSFNGRLPTNEVQFRELTSSLRRVGHILGHTPNSIAQRLHNNRQSRPG